ncbi:hypothetical protein DERF_001655 [Dermatophagoides farinae]|uniref:Uncharacterized protein n=1 Tax=Dermatophagoides farinae TaxID=6954 RepID=A0A922L9V1_DERFA|nr:hypothetical protein DERF_001655 [Dermatophagoides farinae]
MDTLIQMDKDRKTFSIASVYHVNVIKSMIKLVHGFVIIHFKYDKSKVSCRMSFMSTTEINIINLSIAIK